MSLTLLKVVVFARYLGPMSRSLLVEITQFFESLDDQASLMALELGIRHFLESLSEADQKGLDTPVQVIGSPLTLN